MVAIRQRSLASVLALGLLALAAAAPGSASTDGRSWVEKSNENAQILLEVLARFAPEAAGQFGIDGLDEEIFQVPEDINEQNIEALEEALVVLRARRAEEEHPAIAQDLDILIEAAEQQIEGIEINAKYLIPYFPLHNAIFQGFQALLDDQVPAERHPAALVRLRKYAGLEEGYTPLAEQAQAFISSHFDEEGLLGPFSGEIEKDLGNSQRFVDGIEELLKKYGLEGYEEDYAALKEQLAAYETFLREELMSHARADFRLPEEVYANNLKGVGIDMAIRDLVSRAKVSFREIQNEMQALATLIAKERGLESSDYRDVIRDLKKEQLVGDAILPHYQARIKDLEELIRENEVVTLPEREMRIRLASEAESAAIPAPHMRPPRLIGNTGEMGEFVLPLRIPDESGGETGFDDFTFDAASWTLTVHEGRPGHEMQFASIIEKGVSLARIFFAFNSVNVEGWALYTEAEMKPTMPLEGQLISLQHRLLRAARAFLDPGLQLGEIERDTAFKVLEEEVVMSHAMALQEVERYTFWAPGQATAYFCGYNRLLELRADTERLLGDRFNRQEFHDFVLAQGLLPPVLLRQAVMEDFVAPQLLEIEREAENRG